MTNVLIYIWNVHTSMYTGKIGMRGIRFVLAVVLEENIVRMNT